ncbi:hypothetical protein RB195_025377 [Necator americanus]|uniref:Uncharacterized protein n=1 Tax=Necator americanus TaxID=51031 RepID=A0ABR1ES13_NECAM
MPLLCQSFIRDRTIPGFRLVDHIYDCTRKGQSSKTTKKGLSPETLVLIRQRAAALAAGNQELTSELARLYREATKKDFRERRAEVLAEAAEAGKSIRYARRGFCNRRTKITALWNPKGTIISYFIENGGMEKMSYDFTPMRTSMRASRVSKGIQHD